MREKTIDSCVFRCVGIACHRHEADTRYLNWKRYPQTFGVALLIPLSRDLLRANFRAVGFLKVDRPCPPAFASFAELSLGFPDPWSALGAMDQKTNIGIGRPESNTCCYQRGGRYRSKGRQAHRRHSTPEALLLPSSAGLHSPAGRSSRHGRRAR